MRNTIFYNNRFVGFNMNRLNGKNNRKTTRGRKRQIILSGPAKLFVEKYNTFSIDRVTNKKVVHTKKRYRANTNAKPVKSIIHL